MSTLPLKLTDCSALCWLLVASDRQLRHLRTPITPLAPCRFRKGRVQSKAFTRSSYQRGNIHCAWDSHLYQAVDRPLSSVVPSPRASPGQNRIPPRSRLRTLTDLARSKSELVAENTLLRKPLIILRRQVKRPVFKKTDRMLLVLLARAVRTWKQALFIVQPETLLRWHRQGFKLYWKYKSRAVSAKPKISPETVALIKEMASNNRLWGAERMRGELLKLGIRVCLPHDPEVHKTRAQAPCHEDKSGAPFYTRWLSQIWACDFLSVTDLLFRFLFAFFIIELKSRRVIHIGIT